MCVIAHYPDKKPALDELKAMECANHAGAGIAWFEPDPKNKGDTRVHWLKGLKAEDIFQISQEMPANQVVHFRLATVGGISKELCHPFPVSAKGELFEEGWHNSVLFHNGHVNSWEEILLGSGMERPGGAMSDTRAIAIATFRNGWKWLNRLNGFFAVLENEKVHRIGNWTKVDGAYYSNRHFVRTHYQGGCYGGMGKERETEFAHGWEDDMHGWEKLPNGVWVKDGKQYTHPEKCRCVDCQNKRRENEAKAKEAGAEAKACKVPVEMPGPVDAVGAASLAEVNQLLAALPGVQSHKGDCGCESCNRIKVVSAEWRSHILQHPLKCLCALCRVQQFYHYMIMNRTTSNRMGREVLDQPEGISFLDKRNDDYVRKHSVWCICALCKIGGTNGFDPRSNHTPTCSCIHCEAKQDHKLIAPNHAQTCTCKSCAEYRGILTSYREKELAEWKQDAARLMVTAPPVPPAETTTIAQNGETVSTK